MTLSGSADDADGLRALVAALQSLPSAGDDADRIERIRLFEQLKSVAAAAQAAETAAFVASQRSARASEGVPAERRDRGIASQVALARRVSLYAAQRYVGWSMILVHELPETFAALRAGRTSEWRAMIVARETIFLSREGRAEIDRELAPRLEGLSDRAVEVEARKAGYRLDPEGSLARTRAAVADRRVSIRPAPDTMVRLTGLLPVAQGVAAFAALSKAADTVRSVGGDPRSRGQVMADTLVERLTGQDSAVAVPIEVELVLPADALFARAADEDAVDVCSAADTDEPALLVAPGVTPVPIPAGLARELVADASQAWLRRVYSEPATGDLIAMEGTRRLFTDGQRRFVRHRDQFCATPWCGAPIRHIDHVTPAARGGPTDIANARGLCPACNHAVQAAGWRSVVLPDGAIETITPTGHHYRRPPPRPFPSPEQSGSAASASSRLAALRESGRLEFVA